MPRITNFLFRMPAEWEKQQSTLMGWPYNKNDWPGNADSILSGGSPRYNIYKTSDNAYLAAAPLEDRFWKKFCEVIELPKKYSKL